MLAQEVDEKPQQLRTAVLFGIVLFAETPDLPTTTGMVLIVSAGFLALLKR